MSGRTLASLLLFTLTTGTIAESAANIRSRPQDQTYSGLRPLTLPRNDKDQLQSQSKTMASLAEVERLDFSTAPLELINQARFAIASPQPLD